MIPRHFLQVLEKTILNECNDHPNLTGSLNILMTYPGEIASEDIDIIEKFIIAAYSPSCPDNTLEETRIYVKGF